MWSEAVAVAQHQNHPRPLEPTNENPAGEQSTNRRRGCALTGQHFHRGQTFSVLLSRFFKMEAKLFQKFQKMIEVNKKIFLQSRSFIDTNLLKLFFSQYKRQKSRHLKGKKDHQRQINLQGFIILGDNV